MAIRIGYFGYYRQRNLIHHENYYSMTDICVCIA